MAANEASARRKPSGRPKGKSKLDEVVDETFGTGGIDHVLARAIVGVFGLSVIAFLLLMIGSAGGWLHGQMAGFVMFVPFVGLPLGLIMMIVLTIRMGAKRARQAREQR